MVLDRAKELLDLYIQHRERFEESLQEKFPVVASVRRIGTEGLKAIRGALGNREGESPP